MKKDTKRNQKNRKGFLKYYLDLWLSKGTVSMIILLFITTGIIIVVIGVLVWLLGHVEGLTIGKALWDTLNHAFDPGVLSGDNGGFVFLLLMLFATLAGVFFMALLIGLINDGISSRVSDLAKGLEPVIENNHVVILGFNESTMIIIDELINAYKNQKGKRNAIVIMDSEDKQEMEDRIRAQYPDTGNLSIVCRSGYIDNHTNLDRCSILTSKSIIIAAEDDFTTIKAILACTQMLNSDKGSNAYIIAVISHRKNEFAARIAGNDTDLNQHAFSAKNDRLELLMIESSIAKIMTHTCRQNGLSKVFTEIFNFSGYEFYIIDNSGVNTSLFQTIGGKSIREINHYLPKAIAIGVINGNGQVVIGDPDNTILEAGNKLIIFEEDDDIVEIVPEQGVSFNTPKDRYQDHPVKVLIIDCNSKLPSILEEMQHYLCPGSVIRLASDLDTMNNVDAAMKVRRLLRDGQAAGIRFEAVESSDGNTLNLYDYNQIAELLDHFNPDFVLSLSASEEDDRFADEKALLLLLYFRQYKQTHVGADFGVTCEMRSVVNQELATNTLTSDYVISRNIASLMMSQIAENRELKDVFESILDNEGYEIYLKPARYYLDVSSGQPVDIFSVVDAVAEKHEIFLGYKSNNTGGSSPVLNPSKMDNGVKNVLHLNSDDEFIVLAEGPEIK